MNNVFYEQQVNEDIKIHSITLIHLLYKTNNRIKLNKG